jgi:hypothetical protein
LCETDLMGDEQVRLLRSRSELTRRLSLLAAWTVLSAIAGFGPPFPALAEECGAYPDRGLAVFSDLREQEVTLLHHLDATLADVQTRKLLAARVDYEWFSEVWGDIEGTLTHDKPDACVVIRDQMGRIDDALFGRSVPDADLEVSVRALDDLRATVLGLIAPLPSPGGDSPPSPFDNP